MTRYFMNAHSGSVDTMDAWLTDYESLPSYDDQTWEEWGGDELIEVKRNLKDDAWISIEEEEEEEQEDESI